MTETTRAAVTVFYFPLMRAATGNGWLNRLVPI
jgi:hypothetical protein